MRFAVMLAAMAALFVQAGEARAVEMWEIELSGTVTGTSTYYPGFNQCALTSQCNPVVTAYSRGVLFTVIIPAFVGTKSVFKTIGAGGESYDGTLISDGISIWGINLGHSFAGSACTSDSGCTMMSASTPFFTPRVISGSVLGIAPVPEPATWAMMLIGFGLIGATLRYRPTRSSVKYRFTTPSLPPRSKSPN